MASNDFMTLKAGRLEKNDYGINATFCNDYVHVQRLIALLCLENLHWLGIQKDTVITLHNHLKPQARRLGKSMRCLCSICNSCIWNEAKNDSHYYTKFVLFKGTVYSIETLCIVELSSRKLVIWDVDSCACMLPGIAELNGIYVDLLSALSKLKKVGHSKSANKYSS